MKRAALAVLWTSYNVQESGLSVAATIGEAAELQGRHRWGLILPSSARVSLMTYQTVIAVRYPDLVHVEGVISYDMYFSADMQQAGGFLPIIWIFFLLGAAWVKSRAERPSVSEVNRQLHIQIGCKLIITVRDELQRQASQNKFRIEARY